MPSAPPATDPLRAFLSGKRAAPRVEIRLPVLLRAPGIDLSGWTENVSEGGALIRLDAADFSAPGADTLTLLHARLAHGFEVIFIDRPVVRHAMPIRVDMPPTADGDVGVGCAFEVRLRIVDHRALGSLSVNRTLRLPEWEEHSDLGSMPFVVPAKTRLDVFAFDLEGPILGPRVVGSLKEVGGSGMCIESLVAPERGVYRKLGRDKLRCDIRHGADSLWIVDAQPAALRLLPDDNRRVLIGLQSNSTAPRALRQFLVKR